MKGPQRAFSLRYTFLVERLAFFVMERKIKMNKNSIVFQNALPNQTGLSSKMTDGHNGLRLRRVFEYGLSPFVQRTFGPDYWRLYSAFLRGSVVVLRSWTMPVLIFGGLVWWGDSFHDRLHRKDRYVYLIEELEHELAQLSKQATSTTQ